MPVKPYVPAEIEPKWQKYWDDHQAFAASEDHTKPKFYSLIEFPYPSGHGLHVGHPRSNTAMDIISRMRRMQGYNVLFPIGWDAPRHRDQGEYRPFPAAAQEAGLLL